MKNRYGRNSLTHYHNDPSEFSEKNFRKYPRETGKLCKKVFDEDYFFVDDVYDDVNNTNKQLSFDFVFGGFKQLNSVSKNSKSLVRKK